jgi:uncharacterized membrane protein YedE/YeeE
VTRVFALLSGVMFAAGLVLGGMTQPAKVIAFLDLFGAWDPSLILVMGGAIAVYLPVHRLVLRMQTPLFAQGFSLPTRRDLDPPLILGSALFGVGWGLAGYCPGPGVASLGAASTATIVFVAAMLAGMVAFALYERATRPRG